MITPVNTRMNSGLVQPTNTMMNQGGAVNTQMSNLGAGVSPVNTQMSQAGTLDNSTLKNTQSGMLPAANDWFNNRGLGYYPGNPTAPINNMQRDAWGTMQRGANDASRFAQNMGGTFMDWANNPYQIDPNQMPGVGTGTIGQGPQVAPGMIGQGPQVQGQQIGMGPQVQAGMIDPSQGPQARANMVGGGQQVGNIPQVGQRGMDMFNNPYLQNSIQAGMGQNNRNFMQNVMPGIDTGAIDAGMAGSSRHGLAQGSAMGQLNQSNLDMASQMNEQAYNQGMSNFLGQRSQNLGAQTTNAANMLQGQMSNQGDATQRALANQGAGLQASMANQGQWGQNLRANQQAGLQGQLANQAQWGQTAGRNQANNMQGQLANQAQWGQTAGRNQQADLAAQQANQSAWGTNRRQDMTNQLASSGANAGNWLNAMQGNQRNIQGMMGMMPGMSDAYSNAMMAPGAVQGAIGNQQQQQAQNAINAQMQQWDWQRQRPQDQLNTYAGLIGSTQGSALPNAPVAQNNTNWGQAASGLGGIFQNWNSSPSGYNLNDMGYAGPPVGLM